METGLAQVGRSMKRLLLACVLTCTLNACATAPAPFATAQAYSPPVWQVAENPEGHLHREVLWGGMILEVRTEARYTEFEMLGFPLDANQQPQAERSDEGRYVLVVGGFLDPAEFAVGRFITFSGRITGGRRGQLRGEPYVWPTLDTLQPHLWPKDFREEGKRYSIGVGVRL